MADKEIIIDGVDVSGCAYFDYENEGTRECDAYSNECEANNCYYKQLARKTQECESLKEEIEILKDNFDTATRDCNELIEELEQECEELKEQLQANQPTGICETCMAKAILQNDKYLKALKEIEEYINSQGINHKWNMYIQRFRSGILDIISKGVKE